MSEQTMRFLRWVPHLEHFYKNPEYYAQVLERHFFESRVESIDSFWKNFKGKAVVSDFSLYKSSIFARQNLNRRDFKDFEGRFKICIPKFPQPDLMIFLHQPIENLQRNIKLRGRPFEQHISDEYLCKIESGYRAFFRGKISISNTEN